MEAAEAARCTHARTYRIQQAGELSPSHVVTQAELDAGTNIVNTATATGSGATPDDDDASVPVLQTPGLKIDKVTVSGAQSGDGLCGEVMLYERQIQQRPNAAGKGATGANEVEESLTKRFHSALGYRTPNKFESRLVQQAA